MPKSFSDTLLAVDQHLSVRPCPPLNGYAVERMYAETDHRSIDELKRIWSRYSKRKARPGLDPKIAKNVDYRKREAGERLTSAKSHKRILFFIPDLTPATLTATLYTLKETDLWEQGDGFKGDVDKQANKIEADIEYQDELVDRRKRTQFLGDIHHASQETWAWTKLRLGETTVG